jgi:hypothetical protein
MMDDKLYNIGDIVIIKKFDCYSCEILGHKYYTIGSIRIGTGPTQPHKILKYYVLITEGPLNGMKHYYYEEEIELDIAANRERKLNMLL